MISVTELNLNVSKISFELGLGTDSLLTKGQFVVKITLNRLNGLLHLKSVVFMLLGFLFELTSEGSLNSLSATEKLLF